MKNILIAIVLVGLVGAGAYRISQNKKVVQNAANYQEVISDVPVQTVTLSSQLVSEAYSYLGNFEPYREVNFGAEAGGRVLKVLVEEGANVTSGQLLAKVDDEAIQLGLGTQQVGLEAAQNGVIVAQNNLQMAIHAREKAKQDLQRMENLAKVEGVAASNVEQARLGLQKAETDVKQAEIGIQQAQVQIRTVEAQMKSTQKNIANTSIHAPVTGILSKRMFDVGSVLGPGSPLGTITDLSQMKFVALVPENDIASFRKGQSVTVYADIMPDRPLQGTVSMIDVKADATHQFRVTIIVSNRDGALRGGMYGKLTGKASESANKILVPRAALVGSVKQPQVFVVENGKAALKNITVGASFGDNIEVISGLNTGDQVITTGMINLQNGVTVNVE